MRTDGLNLLLAVGPPRPFSSSTFRVYRGNEIVDTDSGVAFDLQRTPKAADLLACAFLYPAVTRLTLAFENRQ
ncbi:hypothetical protein OUZ56_028998 [Daphnia magna]|uniref:Uncharacterized protein n=1 Tax=Daphnia magna TaxID=35525 RepID=A0ABR0B5H8_9CRUS|nr:hypothetical protein OUZ56_028998 [Daphnia magna]